MKKFILFFFALVASVCAFAQGTADFYTLEPTSSYKSFTTTAGWVIENGCVHGGASDPTNASNPHFALFGDSDGAVAAVINGKTTAVGTITSPVLEGGCGTLSLNYAYMFKETSGVSFHVAIVQNGATAAEYDVVDTELAQSTAGSWSQKVAVPGDFQIVITNNCPTQNTKNADRYSIWNLSWTAQAPLPVNPVAATITAVFPNGNKHVVYSNGEKLTAGAEVPADAIAQFDVVSRTENTIVLKAGDQYLHWTSGDNTSKSADLDGLNEEFDETLNTLSLAPATLQGCSTSAEWGKTEEDVQGLYRLQGMGTNGRLFDFTLRENDDAWIAGDPGNIFFDTNWDGNGCRTSFFEIVFEEEAAAVEPVLSADDVHAKHSYYIYTDARGGLTIMDENATNLVGTAEAGVGQEVDATNPLQQFAFVNYEGDLYLYSVGAHKFVNAAAKGILEDTPKTPILFKEAGEDDVMLYFDDKHNFNLGGSKQVTIDGWSDKDAGNSFHIMLADSFDPAPILAVLEAAKNGSAVVTYNYTIGGKVWKTVSSEQKKGETVAAPAEQAFVNIVSYNEDVVAEGLVVNVVCEEALPFTTSTEAKPVYGYLRGHSNQIRYIYVNEEGLGMDERVNEEKTEFADNYLWFISGNLIDGFELHNKAYGVLRATEGQTSVNGDANSVWQLRQGRAGSTLTENIFALWAEGVTYINCQGGLKYWDDNDNGSTFTFNVVETEEPAPTAVTFEIAENEDGTFTVTPSDLEATYFYNVYSPAIRNKWYGGAEVSECVKVDVENYISEPETETHKGVSVVQPASWLKAFYGAEYPYGDYQLIVVAIDQVGAGYAVAGDVLVHNYTYEAPEAPEVTFPEEGKAYVVTNKDSNLFLNIVADDTKAAVLTAEPEKIFFEKKAGGWLIKDEEGNMIGGHAKNWNVAYNIEQVWNVVEVEGGYAFQRTDDNGKYLGFDKIEINPDDFFATAGFRDKNYATAHGVFTIAEYTFPLQGVAYKVKNIDSGLYMNISSAESKNVTIEKTPQEIFFTAAEEGGFYIQNKEGAYIGAGANDWTVANAPATWNVVEVEGGYAFQRTDATNKHLGLDSVQEGSAYWRDKGAAAHYAHLIMLFDFAETTPAEDLAAAIEDAKKVTAAEYANVPADLFEDLAEAIEEAKPFANEDATVFDINNQLAALEAAVNAIKNYVPETVEELLARLQAAVAAGKAIVKDNTVEDKCMGGLPGYKALDLVQAVASDVEAYDGATTVTRDEVVAVEHNVKYYNKALPCIPEVGKTYIIRNHPTRFGDQYSYVITAGEEGRELIPYTKVKDNVEDKHLWTVSEHVFKVEDDWGDLLFSETRYVFTNVATGQIFGYNGAKLDLCEKETDMNCWYFTQKTPMEIFAGSTELPYGTLGLQYNDGGNKYKYTTVDMRTSDLNISGSDVPMHALWNTYSSAFIFDVYEPEVTEWNGEAPTVAVEDATTVKVTFTDANSVEATNYGVLAAIYDEQGDVYGIVFDALFDDAVEFEGSTATLCFKKISELNAELAGSAVALSNKVLSAVDGVDVKGKVVICGKSFKIDGTTVYTKPIVSDFDFNAGGIATGINGIATDADAKIFDLQGRRVVVPANGLFIREGKKVVK